MPGHRALPVVIVVLRNARCRRQDVVNRLAEPLLRAAANELAANDQDEHARNDRQAEKCEHQLGAKTRERQTATPFDHELDDVAGQHEDERHEHRQVGRGECVEDDLGQEVGVELCRTVGEAHHRHQRGDEKNDAEKDEARIVAKGPPLWPCTTALRAGSVGRVASRIVLMWMAAKDVARRRAAYLRNVNLASPAMPPSHGQTNEALRGLVWARTRM